MRGTHRLKIPYWILCVRVLLRNLWVLQTLNFILYILFLRASINSRRGWSGINSYKVIVNWWKIDIDAEAELHLPFPDLFLGFSKLLQNARTFSLPLFSTSFAHYEMCTTYEGQAAGHSKLQSSDSHWLITGKKSYHQTMMY